MTTDLEQQRQRADLAEQLSLHTLELLRTSLEVLADGPNAEAIKALELEVSKVRDELNFLRGRVTELEGLRPELPPMPPEGKGLPRYGIRWNGPQQPLAVPMADGYWTPHHLAEGPHALVLGELAEERQRQEAKWGEQNHPDLSPEVPTSTVERAAEDMCLPSAHVARSRVENLAARGKLGYADIALEEFAEAIEAAALGVTTELRKELVQTAAVLVAWIQCIDRRRSRARK